MPVPWTIRRRVAHSTLDNPQTGCHISTAPATVTDFELRVQPATENLDDLQTPLDGTQTVSPFSPTGSGLKQKERR